MSLVKFARVDVLLILHSSSNHLFHKFKINKKFVPCEYIEFNFNMYWIPFVLIN